MDALSALLIYIIVAGILIGIVAGIVAHVPFLSEPYRQWVRWALAGFFCVLVLVKALPLLGAL